MYKRASTRNLGNNRIVGQRRLRRGCAYAQPRLSLRFSHTQRKEVEEGSDQILDLKPHWIHLHGPLKVGFAHMR